MKKVVAISNSLHVFFLSFFLFNRSLARSLELWVVSRLQRPLIALDRRPIANVVLRDDWNRPEACESERIPRFRFFHFLPSSSSSTAFSPSPFYQRLVQHSLNDITWLRDLYWSNLFFLLRSCFAVAVSCCLLWEFHSAIDVARCHTVSQSLYIHGDREERSGWGGGVDRNSIPSRPVALTSPIGSWVDARTGEREGKNERRCTD